MTDDNPSPIFDDRTTIERQQLVIAGLRQEIARLTATIDEVLGRLSDTQHLAADLREQRDIARVENARTCRREAELRDENGSLKATLKNIADNLNAPPGPDPIWKMRLAARMAQAAVIKRTEQ